MSKTEIREYKEKFSFEERTERSAQMRRDNKEKYPVVLLRSKTCKYSLPAHR
jgi:hypothetical protein